MAERKKVSTSLSNGVKVIYDVVLTFVNNDNKKSYVVYTDNSYDQNNRGRLYVGVYDFKLENPYLGEPKTKEEWIYIGNVLDKVIVQK